MSQSRTTLFFWFNSFSRYFGYGYFWFTRKTSLALSG